MENNNATLLECKGIIKQFNGIQVLKSVDLNVRRGEVHALMGENGAGKSTIIKIITGVYTRDAGEIYMDGELVNIQTRQDSRDCGISVIYQELSLLPALTVTENIYLGQEIKGKLGLPDWKLMRKETKELIDRYGFDIDPDAIVETLGMAKRQMVEILKALAVKAKLIIMDEPTASLAASESEKLFETIDNLRSKGAAILYISHRLDEVYRLSDRLTVMRDGCNVGVLEKEEIEPKRVIELMLGHTLKNDDDYERRPLHEENVLEVKDLYYKNMLKGISFKAYGGEILGIGGLVGSGRTELISCIYGALKQDSGTITYNGEPVSHSILKNMKKGFGLVPEDRRNEGFIPKLSIQQNFALASYDKIAPAGVVSGRKE
ncbi:MAG: sugar ABC transporter ATP-binding protein, partial [Oscillospiraceae bacterium]|nr:sugar ABC transporter ATP-binding protein [Oscillospiraceae bacterium]